MKLLGTLTLGLIVGLNACHDATSPAPLPMQVAITGIVRDSTGLPLIGAIVAYTSYDQGVPDLPPLPVQTDASGAYRAIANLIPEADDSLLVRVLLPGCDAGWGPASYIPIAGRSARDTLYQVDFTLPVAVPRPSANARRLCAQDRYPNRWFDYSTRLTLDSAQYHATATGTFIGGSWEHHTSGSVVSDTGTFVGVVTPGAVVLTLTYGSIVYPSCGPTVQLQGIVLPTGQWSTVDKVSSARCPVGTLHLAFAPY